MKNRLLSDIVVVVGGGTIKRSEEGEGTVTILDLYSRWWAINVCVNCKGTSYLQPNELNPVLLVSVGTCLLFSPACRALLLTLLFRRRW